MSEPAYDARRYACCAPWYGQRGPDFTRRFRVEFLGALHGYADEFATLHEHLQGIDPGGPNGLPDANGVVQPVDHPGNAAIQASSARCFAARAKRLYSLIWSHIEDPDLRDELADIVPADGVRAWALVLSRGELPATGLTAVNEEVAWATLKLADVGINEETITRYHGLLSRVNRDRQAPYPEHARWIKFLASITFPVSLKDKASSELQRSSYTYGPPARPTDPPAGSPDLRATVQAFDELWRLSYARGEIRFVPAPKRGEGLTNRVDAMVVEAEPPAPPSDLPSQQCAVFDACYTATGRAGASILCYNCWGAGHRQAQCPSQRQQRSIAEAISTLQSMQGAMRRSDSGVPSGYLKPPSRAAGSRDGHAAGSRDHTAPPRAERRDDRRPARPPLRQPARPVQYGRARAANAHFALPEAASAPEPRLDVLDMFGSDCFTLDIELQPTCSALATVPAAPLAVPLPSEFDTCKSFAAVIDSGARRHVAGSAQHFPASLITDHAPDLHVRVASGARYPVAFVGTLVLRVGVVHPERGASSAELRLRDALYVPGLPSSLLLLSTRAMYDVERIETHLNDVLHLRLPSGDTVPFAAADSNYLLPLLPSDCSALVARRYSNVDRALPPLNPDVVHARLAHFSFERIRASAACTTGLNLRGIGRHACKPCELGGARHKAPQRGQPRRYTFFGECVASDTIAMPKSSPFGFIGMVCFKDAATNYVAIYYIRSHTSEEIRACLKQYLADHQAFFTSRGVVTWFTDNHGEFYSDDTDKFLAELCIRHKSIPPHNPQNNPSERVWSILLRPIRIMHAAADVGDALWPFAAAQACRITNSLATCSEAVITPGITPYEMASGRQPNLAPLRVLFCACTCLIRSTADLARITKVSPRAVAAVHLGIDAQRGGYYVYVPEWQRLTTFKLNEVRFDELVFPRLRIIVGTHVVADQRIPLPSEDQQQLPRTATPLAPPVVTAAAPAAIVPPAPLPISSRLRSSAAHRVGVINVRNAVPICVIDAGVLAVRLDELHPTPLPPPPRTLTAASRSPEAEQWMSAARAEITAKLENGTYELVPRPAGRKIIKTRFVLTRKLHDDGSIKRYSARWVACGYSQVHGVDYDQTFTATAKAASVRVFVGTCAYYDLHMQVADVVKAFTTSDIDEDLYVEQPELFVEGERQPDGRPALVAKLRKALEGLKQSGALFQADNVKHLQACGLTQLESEPCIFLKIEGNERLMLLVWVDDVLIGYSHEGICARFLASYRKRYAITTAPLDRYIGIQLSRDRPARTITLTQETYLLRLGAKFLAPDGLLVPTPVIAVPNSELLALAVGDAADAQLMQGKPYLSLMATVLYATVMTRPDAAHLSSVLCRYMANPSPPCYVVLLHLANYLHSTAALGITLGGDPRMPNLTTVHPAIDEPLFRAQHGLLTCSDASWKTNHTYCGHAVLLYNGAVDWACKLLRVIAHSTAEAETAAACFAAKRHMFVLTLLNELKLRVPAGAVLLIDNSAAKQLAERMGVSKRTEHYMRWQHYLRHLVVHRHLVLSFIRTHEQPADILTKVTDKATFLGARKFLLNT